MATFITSKSVGELLNLYVETTSGNWRYFHNGTYSSIYSNGSGDGADKPVENANGEFTIISCDVDGNESGNITTLGLGSNQLTSFDGTGLSSLTTLNLNNNQLTSLSGFTFPTGLTDLNLDNNQLTGFTGTGLSGLTYLVLQNNPITPEVNDSILDTLESNGLESGQFYTSNGRTAASTSDYDTLISRNWDIQGADLPPTPPSQPVTFITSKSVGESVSIYIETTTGYFKYFHNGVYSYTSTRPTGNNIEVLNSNGEFTIMSSDENGNESGDVMVIGLSPGLGAINSPQSITSFDGTGLSGLTALNLNGNQLTSFDGTGLSSLTGLYLNSNQLTSFDGTGLSGLTVLELGNNPLTSFNGGDMGLITSLSFPSLNINTLTGFTGGNMTSLTTLYLENNQLTSFDGTGLSSLTELNLSSNQLTSFDGIGLSGLTTLVLQNNQLTSLDEFTFPTSLSYLNLEGNQLTSFDGTGLSSLTYLYLGVNQLTTFSGTGLSSLSYLDLSDNGLTSLSGFIFPTSLTELSLNSTGKGGYNYLTSFEGNGLPNLIQLTLNGNPLTSFDGSGLSSLTILSLSSCPITPQLNDSILDVLESYELSNGTFVTEGVRTSSSTSDYNILLSRNWGISGADLPTPPSSGKLRIKGVGQY